MNIAIFIVGIIGLAISYKILYNKKHEINVCPIGSNCKKVLDSKHNNFLGIPNEINGLMYYGIIVITYGITLLEFEPLPSLKAFLLIIAAGAFIFSIYLTLIQGFQLKNWCTWCLGSAVSSTIIFILTLLYIIPYMDGILDFLITQRNTLSAVYSLGIALGLGSITTLYFLLYRFLNDFKLTKKEKDVFHYITQIVWFGLIMILLAGLGLFFIEKPSPISDFRTIIIILLVLIEGIITLFIIPHLSKLSVRRKVLSEKLWSWRNAVLAIGAMSIFSWYTLFISDYLSPLKFSLEELLFLYTGFIITSILASQILEAKDTNVYLSEQKK